MRYCSAYMWFDALHQGEFPGARRDRYELLSLIAQGGMAAVWLARQHGMHGFERLVALKTILPQHAADPLFQRMFLAEARIASRIDHPNVAQILDVGDGPAGPYLVMEWVNGDSLHKLARAMESVGETLPHAILLRILADACSGLHAAHELRDVGGEPLGLVHRDVSPPNILIDAKGAVKLIDFGIAKITARSQSDTHAGLLKGKINYMAPEQARGEEVDRRTDTWALGAVLHHMLAGTPPYFVTNDHDTLSRLMRGGAPNTLPKSVPAPLVRLLARALARDKADRFATAAELRYALEIAIEMCGGPASADDVAHFVQTHRRSAHETEAMLLLRRRPSPRRPALNPRAFDDEATLSSDIGRPVSRTAHAHPRPRLRVTLATGVASCAVFGALAVGAPLVPRYLPQRTPAAPRAPEVIGAPLATEVPNVLRCPGGMAMVTGNAALGSFCIDLHEVTTKEYVASSAAGACEPAGLKNASSGITGKLEKTFDPLCNARDPSARADHPINCVGWSSAEAYCNAQDRRLPTDAEWEYAARGADGRSYPWGNGAPSSSELNACGPECVSWARKSHLDARSMYPRDDGWPTTAPVGSFPNGNSPFGAVDMAGNVWEWVADPDGDGRRIRGGAWNAADAASVLATSHEARKAEARSYAIGFRCAKTL